MDKGRKRKVDGEKQEQKLRGRDQHSTLRAGRELHCWNTAPGGVRGDDAGTNSRE